MNNWKFGENLFKEQCESRGWQVTSVADNPDYWNKDIDFIVYNPDSGNTVTAEVKWDSRINSTKNLYLETENSHSDGGRGWFNFCEADVLAYGNAVTNEFYMIPFKELKERVEKQLVPYRVANCGSDSIGLLVNMNHLQDIARALA